MNIVNEKNARGFRQYFYEYIVIALVFAVCTLFYMYTGLNTFIRTELFNNTVRMEQMIEKNIDAMNDFKRKI